MDLAIKASIIGGVCTITAPILALVIKDHFEKKKYLTISKGRQTALQGNWEGLVYQRGIPPNDYELSMTLVPDRKKVNGTAHYRINNRTTSIKLTGGFIDSKHLKIDYINENPGVIQYGTVLVSFSSNSKELKGEFLGYGIETEDIVSGEIVLEKK